MVQKEFVTSNYSFERCLEDQSATILKELFKGLELEETGNQAGEDDMEAGDEIDTDDDHDDLILMIDEGNNQDEPELL